VDVHRTKSHDQCLSLASNGFIYVRAVKIDMDKDFSLDPPRQAVEDRVRQPRTSPSPSLLAGRKTTVLAHRNPMLLLNKRT
jgi:hypothetical protein